MPALIQAHRWRLALGASAVLVVAVTVVVAAADARARIPKRVEIADVAVGGASAVEAERLVQARAKELAQRPLLVVGPEGSVRTSGVQLGARPQVTAAVAAAGSRRFARTRGWLESERVRRLPLRWKVDARAVRQLAERLGPSAPPSEAAVVVRADGVHVRAGRAGYEVNSEALRSRLESLSPRVHVPTTHVHPEITTAEARATAHQIERLTGTPRTILLGPVATTLESTTLRTLVRVHPGEGGLSVSFDAGRLAKLLPASVAPRDAELRVRGANVELVPAVQGRILDVAATALRSWSPTERG